MYQKDKLIISSEGKTQHSGSNKILVLSLTKVARAGDESTVTKSLQHLAFPGKGICKYQSHS